MVVSIPGQSAQGVTPEYFPEKVFDGDFSCVELFSAGSGTLSVPLLQDISKKEPQSKSKNNFFEIKWFYLLQT